MAEQNIVTGEEISPNNRYSRFVTGKPSSVNRYRDYALTTEQQTEERVAKGTYEEIDREEEWTSDDLMMAARLVVDGLWLNKSEEVGSWISAAAFKAFYPELSQGKDITTIREEMLADLESETAEFMERKPIAGTVGQITGNIFSPVSIAGGALLTTAARLRQGQAAVKGGAGVRAAVGGQVGLAADDAATLSKMASYYAAQAPTKTVTIKPLERVLNKAGIAMATKPTPVVSAAVGAPLAAVAGFEGENTDEALKNAGLSFAAGAVIPFGFEGIKKTYSGAVNNKMAQQLGQGKDFINLMFTEHPVAPVYRSVVSKAYGGMTLTEQQVRSVASKIAPSYIMRKAAVNLKETAKDKVARAKKANALELKLSKSSLDDMQSDAVEKLRLNEKLATNSAQRLTDDEVDRLTNIVNASKDDLKAIAVKEADEAVNAVQGQFRADALTSAAPGAAPKDEVTTITTLDPQDALKALDDLWKKYGYATAKSKTYKIEPDQVIAKLRKLHEDDPDVVLVGRQLDEVLEYAEVSLNKLTTKGQITGEDLVNLRSRIGSVINRVTENDPLTRNYVDSIKDYFDTVIRNGLNPAERKAFDAENGLWATKRLVEESTRRATGGKAVVQGAFTAEDWIESSKAFSRYMSARGNVNLQREAQDIANLARQRNDAILQKANTDVNGIVSDLKSQIKLEKKSLSKAKDDAAVQLARDIKDVRERFSGLKQTAEVRARVKDLVTAAREKHKVQLANLEQQAKDLNNKEKELARFAPKSFDASVFERLFNTALVGQVLTATTPEIGKTLGTGVVGSRLLATETAQRIFAKQTGLQKGISGFVDRAEQATVPLREAGLRAPSVAATTPFVSTTSEKVLDKEAVERIKRLPYNQRARVKAALERSGKMSLVKAQEPELYRLLHSK